MIEINSIVALSLFALLFYSFQATRFAIRILENKSISFLKNTILAILNFVFFTSSFYLNVPYHITYLLVFLALFVEFRLFSKAKNEQVFFGALTFMLNIAPVHLVTVSISSFFRQIPSSQILLNPSLKAHSILVSFIILNITLLIFKKIVPISSVLSLSTTRPYSAVVLITALVMFSNTLVDAWLFISTKSYFEIVIVVISNALFSYIFFYFTFLFSISLIKLHKYKRKSDEIESDYHKVIVEKNIVNQKMYSDDLTGLYNRKYLNEKIDLLLQDKKSTFAFVFLDITGLKYVNDTHGHDMGDKYINIVSQVLLKSIREIDSAIRIGGDEFVLILEHLLESEVDIILNRIKANLEKENVNASFLINASIGSLYVDNSNSNYDKSSIFEKADELMRKDKQSFYRKMGT